MGFNTMLHYQGLADQNATSGQKLDTESESEPIVNAATITEAQRTRLSVATPILVALIQADSVASLSGSGNNDEFTLVVRAIEYADLLINEINKK